MLIGNGGSDVINSNITYLENIPKKNLEGFLLSSTQQMVDRLVVQTQDTIRSLAQESTDSNNEINLATGLIQDADNSKQLLPRLQEVAQRREESGNPIEVKLRQMSDELHAVVVGYLQGTLESMMKCAEDQCPHVLANGRVQQEIRLACKEKNFLSSEFVRFCVAEQAGTDIMNKVNSSFATDLIQASGPSFATDLIQASGPSFATDLIQASGPSFATDLRLSISHELNLAVAAHVSDRTTDEVIETLSRSYKALVGDMSKKRSSTPDVLRSRSRVSSDSSRNDPNDTYSMADTISQQSDQSPLATPHLSSKRKSLHGRKLRPKSVVDTIDGLSADDIPDLLPSLPKSAEGIALGERESNLCPGPLNRTHDTNEALHLERERERERAQSLSEATQQNT
uniref:CARMIL C-terminal domain-containing protein n=1 Tax=Timema shepardi TaxID=629360 RepID=A0A7R9B796_TIMSH|nr:unnamed protein product [Timema shepardi]